MHRISQKIEELSKLQGNILAIISETKSISFGFLYEQILICSRNLLDLNLPNDACCVLVFDDSPEHFIISLSLLNLGITQISFSSEDVQKEIQILENELEFHCLITNSGSFEQNSNFEIIKSSELFKQNLKNNLETVEPIDKDKIVFLNVGSGTTGNPKIIGKSYEQIEAISLDRQSLVPVARGERFYSLIKLHFGAGLLRNLTSLLSGLTCIFSDKPQNYQPNYIDRLPVDHISTSDAHLCFLIDAGTKKFSVETLPRFQRLKSVLVFGSPLSAERVSELKSKISPFIYVLYGTNETAAITIANPDDLEKYPNTIGREVSDAEIKLVSQNNEIITSTEVGTVFIKAKGMSLRYINNTQADAENFQDGWFKPKDLMHRNQEGLLFFDGRSDDLIIFDGVNIFPIELESVLYTLKEVKECAAFPVTLPDRGIVPAVSIVVDEAYKETHDLTFFKDFMHKQMGWKEPRLIDIRSSFPKNPRGKILKYKIRESIEKHLN